MPHEWALHYASWMIEDGCPDRKVGDVFDWPGFEYWSANGLAHADEPRKSARLGVDFKYMISAEVTHLSEQSCVVDFGLSPFGTPNLLPAGCSVGGYVTGEVTISLSLLSEIPPDLVSESLKQKWKVNRIQADLTPFVERDGNPRFFSRDESRIQYQKVQATREVSASNYVLICSEVG